MRTISIIATALLAAIPAALAADTTTSTTVTSTYIKGVEEPSAAPTLGAAVVQGCFSNPGKLVKAPLLPFNSKDSCAKTYCHDLGKMVAATMAGSICYCGDKYPPLAARVDDSQCNIGCTGYDQQACGGFNISTNAYFWTIYNTGVSLAVESEPESILSKTTSTSSTETATSTAAASTVYVSETPSAAVPTSVEETGTSNSGTGTKSNTTGITVGVVVGLVALAGIIGGVFFYMRRKRSRELDEKKHRDAVINNFFGGKPGSSGGYSVSDARLDPVLAQRRDSIGSIADNQDYSRKILRVTNA